MLIGRELVLELRDVPVMLPMSAAVHPKEGGYNEDVRDKGLRDECEGHPSKELPEVVGASNDRIAMEDWDATGEVAVSLAEAP
jgi:hypothetical protein